MSKVKKLEAEFEGRGQVKGYHFKRVMESDNAYVYRVSDKDDPNKSVHYEVFRRKINTRFNVESYPGQNSFGKWAWTCMYLGKAVAKFIELNCEDPDPSVRNLQVV